MKALQSFRPTLAALLALGVAPGGPYRVQGSFLPPVPVRLRASSKGLSFVLYTVSVSRDIRLLETCHTPDLFREASGPREC